MDLFEKIVTIGFPPEQYYREEFFKNQIVIHHTVSGRGVKGDIDWWLSDKTRVATCMIVDSQGIPYQLYGSQFWGHHLGIKGPENYWRNRNSIGIELDAWGGLIKKGDIWYVAKWDKVKRTTVPDLNIQISSDRIQLYEDGYRGYYAFEKYTNAQIETLKELLLYWGEKYSIPLDYNEKMWDISQEALTGKPGVWSHTSFRADKSDAHPQPELIKMLKSLKNGS